MLRKYLYSFPKGFILLSVPNFLFRMIQKQNLKEDTKNDINAYTHFKRMSQLSLLRPHYLEVIVYGVSNHCSSFKYVSDLPLHSLHVLSCG